MQLQILIICTCCISQSDMSSLVLCALGVESLCRSVYACAFITTLEICGKLFAKVFCLAAR